MTPTIHNTAHNKNINGLYLITDDSPPELLHQRVATALRGGVRIVQYRDKTRCSTEKYHLAKKLQQLCKQHHALFIINDSVELAQYCQADGVHLGQKDGSIAQARKLLGDQAIIGVSTRTIEMAQCAEQQGADYIGVGSVYPTGTKQDAVHIGLSGLKAIRQTIELPIVAIGGINTYGLSGAIEAGADAAAVVSAVMADPQPEIAARELALQFRRHIPLPQGRVLTIAGSDSGGGAGIQADIKTITLLGSYASSVITALTAQNTLGVSAIHAPGAEFVQQQLRAVLSDIGTDVIKTGMLYSAEIIETIADTLEDEGALCVIDPVMIAKGGSNLLQQSAIDAFIRRLLPKAYLLTPNVPEAEALTGLKITDLATMELAARRLQQMGARNVLLKGGHLAGDPIDLLLQGTQCHHFAGKRIDSVHTHGTGCTTASVIATLLAQGYPLHQAVQHGKQFITQAIRNAPHLGSGHGPINHYTAALTIVDQHSTVATNKD
ncbi:MAG: bifunctional hydroxymethylpyrimidine kinase/phosphomethylpyrimidine kinase [Thermodesulfobacteriota bacterium]|nr:bifunctional hydroxymethylpyrimidine kinase/phosphomethylpyrimidine kinase [Thermodesulfobacteriota bacterium]